jgi:hypothetical protein
MSSPEVVAGQQESRQMQLRMALHNCISVLKLPSGVPGLLKSTFLENEAALALCVFEWDDDEEVDVTLVAASSELFARLPRLSVPQSLSELVNSEDLESLANSRKFSDAVLYKRNLVRLVDGAEASMLATSLSRLSMSEAAGTEFGILLFDFDMDNGKRHERWAFEHCFWYEVAGERLSIRCDTGHQIAAPITVCMPEEIAGTPIWEIVFAIPVCSSAAGAPEAVLAVPRESLQTEAISMKRREREEVFSFSADAASRVLQTASRVSNEHREEPPSVLKSFVELPSEPGYGRARWLNSPSASLCSEYIRQP